MSKMFNNTKKFLLISIISLLSLLCVSCGSSTASNGEVYIYCYGDYYDQTVIEQFEEETGITVVQDTYDTAEEMFTVLQNGSASYDCICTSDYMIEKMIESDMLSEINYDNIPEIKNIEKIYMEKSEVFDPGNKFSVPYQAGVAGILYDKTKVGNKKIDSWDVLWDKDFKGQIVMPDSVRDAFQIALNKNGYSLNSANEKEIEKAAKDLISQKGLVYKYANDSARDLLADGSAVIGVVWNGEYSYTIDLNENVEFVVPKEGSEFFIDSWVLSKDAANKENAEKWINFLTRADIAAKNFEYLYYTTPNKAAKELIDREDLANEAIFPTEETINRCDSLRKLDSNATDLYSKYWKKVKSN